MILSAKVINKLSVKLIMSKPKVCTSKYNFKLAIFTSSY